MTDRADRLERQAREATGLGDFGEPSWRDGLERLVASIEREAQLNAAGDAVFDAQITGLLANRLQVEDWYRRHPEIEEQEIAAPLIGLGLPRTGSTALSCLLAEDPAARCIRNWEAQWPCPPPESATGHDDPRIERAREALARRHAMFPRMKMLVPSTATSPTECQTFMGMAFRSQLFQSSAWIPSYVHWLNHEADMVPAYRYVKRVLKLLQWRCPPRRWRLKNPSHTLFIDALDAVFPDARFWMTHRDVAEVLPSVTDLYLELQSTLTDEANPRQLGALTADFCELGMRRMIDFRERGNDARFFDIHFGPFMHDPFPALEALYDFLGETLTDETRERMATWRRDTPRDRHGEHRPDTAAFGLEPAAVRARFRFYHDRFGVHCDA